MTADKQTAPEEPMKQRDVAWDAFITEAQRLATLARTRRAAKQQESAVELI